MEQTIVERALEYAKCKKLNAAEFERFSGLSNGMLKSLSKNTRRSTFDRISKAFPDLNIQWLKTGSGEMLNPGVPSPSFDANPDSTPSASALLDIIHSQQETIRSLSETVRQLAKGE